MFDDITLLEGYVERRSEADFERLVERHLGMVFATALRRLRGDAHLAQDVAQTVFIDLARKSPSLLHCRTLAGWLYASTVYAAANTVRGEQRRRRREENAHTMHELDDDTSASADWTRVRPVLDDALSALSRRDRDAILLRFFHEQGFSAVGAALNLSENAARMRVERALDKLRGQLARRGIQSTLAALGATLSVHGAAVSPPAALAATVAHAALASTSGASGATVLFNLLAMTKIKVGLAAAVTAVGGAMVSQELLEQSRLRAASTQAASALDEAARIRSEISHLEQSAADVQALRLGARQLAQVRRESSELQERIARLDTTGRTTARSRAARSARVSADPAPEPAAAALDAMPTATHTVTPKYPYELKRAGIPGEVRLSVIVDSEGRAQDPKVIEATHPAFIEPTLEAVRQWQFSSGRKGGRAVNTRMELPFAFHVQDPNWF